MRQADQRQLHAAQVSQRATLSRLCLHWNWDSRPCSVRHRGRGERPIGPTCKPQAGKTLQCGRSSPGTVVVDGGGHGGQTGGDGHSAPLLEGRPAGSGTGSFKT